MSVITLIENAVIPPVYAVRQQFADDAIRDIEAAVIGAMNASGMALPRSSGAHVALGVGSRGIAGLPVVVAAVVAWFKDKGFRPFIVPAMGSHGGATAEGQTAVLAGLGITEASVHCPIRSCMETVEVGATGDGMPVFMDALASAADGIFVINRVKPHTTFTGRHESGLVKMLSIGLGKQKGAEQCHALGYGVFDTLMPAMAEVIAHNAPLLGGLAIVENAFDQACHVEAVPRDAFINRDAALLELARAKMPSLPVDFAHILLVGRMGKDISGTGMDPNITGRSPSPYKSVSFTAVKAGVLRLTPASKGNAAGVGMADVIPDRLLQQIDFGYTYANLITSTILRAGFVPVVMPNDSAVLQCLVHTCNAGGDVPRLIYLRDTLTLDRFWASEPVAREMAANANCEVDMEPVAFTFDHDGALTGPGWADSHGTKS